VSSGRFESHIIAIVVILIFSMGDGALLVSGPLPKDQLASNLTIGDSP